MELVQTKLCCQTYEVFEGIAFLCNVGPTSLHQSQLRRTLGRTPQAFVREERWWKTPQRNRNPLVCCFANNFFCKESWAKGNSGTVFWRAACVTVREELLFFDFFSLTPHPCIQYPRNKEIRKKPYTLYTISGHSWQRGQKSEQKLFTPTEYVDAIWQDEFEFSRLRKGQLRIDITITWQLCMFRKVTQFRPVISTKFVAISALRFNYFGTVFFGSVSNALI